MIQCFTDTSMNHPNYQALDAIKQRLIEKKFLSGFENSAPTSLRLLTGTKIKYALKEFMETTTRY